MAQQKAKNRTVQRKIKRNLKYFTLSRLTLIGALILSMISAFFSIAGLTTIFSGQIIAMTALAATLELCKVLSVAWLGVFWNRITLVFKLYLVPAVLCLMLITSMGTFGYLTRSYLANNANSNISELNIQSLEQKLELTNKNIQSAETSIAVLDKIASEAAARDSNFVRNNQRQERRALKETIADARLESEITREKLLKYQTKRADLETEIGPLRYIAGAFVGGNHTTDDIVRIIIIAIVVVFDPLAIILILVANRGLEIEANSRRRNTTQRKRAKQKAGKVVLNKNSILNFSS